MQEDFVNNDDSPTGNGMPNKKRLTARGEALTAQDECSPARQVWLPGKDGRLRLPGSERRYHLYCPSRLWLNGPPVRTPVCLWQRVLMSRR